MGGSHGPQDLPALVRSIRRELHERDGHAIVLAFGEPGTGKTSAMLQLATEVQQRLLNVGRQVVFRAIDGIKLAETLPKGSVMVYDEAIVAGGNRRRAMSRENTGMTEHLATGRKRNLCQVFISPYPDDLDTAILKHAHYRFDFGPRGHATVSGVEKFGIKKTAVWYDSLFEVDFQSTEKVMPETWRDYQAQMGRRMAAPERDQATEVLAVERFEALVRRRGVAPERRPS